MPFQARIGVGDTIVGSTEVMGVPNVVLYLETADGDLGDVVVEWRGAEVAQAFETGELSRESLHRTAYFQARARGAFEGLEHSFAEAALRLEGLVLREMRGDLASLHRPWMEAEDEEWVVDAAAAAARRLLHHEGGPLAEAPRGMRHDAVEHLADVGVAAEAAWRAGPTGAEVRIEGVPAHLRATSTGDVEIRVRGGLILASAAGGFAASSVPAVDGIDDTAIAEAVGAYLAAHPDDVAAASYAATVARTRDIGRMAAELEARASLLHEERDGIVRHLSDVLVASVSAARDDDVFPPPPAP
jgi:hypothetical protein